jgi:hypothetical protein
MPTNAPLPRVKQAGEATDAKGLDAFHDKAVTFPTQIEIASARVRFGIKFNNIAGMGR